MANARRSKSLAAKVQETANRLEELAKVEARLLQIGGAIDSHRGALNKLSDEYMVLMARRKELKALDSSAKKGFRK